MKHPNCRRCRALCYDYMLVEGLCVTCTRVLVHVTHELLEQLDPKALDIEDWIKLRSA
jgi:hypothetical protein